MAGQESKSQKTEKPTGRKLRKALEKGNVARSEDVGQTVSLAVFLLWASFGGGIFLTGLLANTRSALIEVGRAHGPAVLLDRCLNSMVVALSLLAPLLGALVVFAILGQIAQSGFHPKKNPIEFDLKKINLVEGMKKLVDVKKLFAAGKALVKLLLYGLLAAMVVIPEWTKISALAFSAPSGIFDQAATIVGRILTRAFLLGAAISVIDYAFTRYRWYQDLYMTKQEVKDEHKENEGDPQIRGRIRGMQREASRKRMMSAVKTADVVVTNPTHVAVALKYDKGDFAAPVVVAKGINELARRIKEEARRHGVPIVEDPPLARALERLCPLGAAIPEELYRAVAEVFAYVLGRHSGVYRPHTEKELETSDKGDRR
ncbi:MAG: EscU/YscU/HrcU family type III secretion system export apparatus switch protein [Acidobacteriota bacterium]|nr:EscU/YscU/HrcU family type III secretion system export apparatus switch protein [Acidobacteriota bacterium]MDQ7088961.1 EscU/YscU/HrcU family type III secretion system export apparatus switch protein [Acidobacteriota bacterium]